MSNPIDTLNELHADLIGTGETANKTDFDKIIECLVALAETVEDMKDCTIPSFRTKGRWRTAGNSRCNIKGNRRNQMKEQQHHYIRGEGQFRVSRNQIYENTGNRTKDRLIIEATPSGAAMVGPGLGDEAADLYTAVPQRQIDEAIEFWTTATVSTQPLRTCISSSGKRGTRS